MVLRIILNSFAWLLLAAHYSRADNVALMILSLLIPFLYLIRKRWSLVGLQILTYAGALVWVQTAISYVRQRMETGEDWGRLAIILLAVTGYTVLTGLLLNSEKIKPRYPA